MSKNCAAATWLLLCSLVLVLVGSAKAERSARQADGTLFLPVITYNYPCYSVEVLSVGPAIEYHFKCGEQHFMTLIDEGGTLILRPHPGRDVNGWGSSWYVQPFIHDASFYSTSIDSVVAYPDHIHVSASGQVSQGAAGSYGTWDIALDFTYDSVARRVSGTGLYHVALAGELTGIGDLNLYKIASNYLIDVPLLGGGRGNTGDMTSATICHDAGFCYTWIPPQDHCPLDQTERLSIEAVGHYNNVDTAELGDEPIQPAYKPSLKVTLTNVEAASTGMIFCGFYAEALSQVFSADNVGLHAVIRQGTTQTTFDYEVGFESQAAPDECTLPSSC